MSDLDLDAFNAVLETHPTAWQYCATDGTGIIADAVRAAVDAARAPLLAEVERLKANQPDGGEWAWLYGFKASDGKFHTYGSATTPRRQNLYGNRLYRQRAFLGEVEPIPDEPAERVSKPSGTAPESTTDQTTPNGA